MSHALCIAVIVVLVIAIVAFVAVRASDTVGKLAGCGWTLYTLKGCGHCERQKLVADLYPVSAEYASDGTLVSSNLGNPPPIPFSAIKAFPYWHNVRTGASLTGYQDSAALKKMAQC
jgi:hypothetical protein